MKTITEIIVLAIKNKYNYYGKKYADENTNSVLAYENLDHLYFVLNHKSNKKNETKYSKTENHLFENYFLLKKQKIPFMKTVFYIQNL